jgi:hypothetical protein
MNDAQANGQPQGAPIGAAPAHTVDPTEPGDAAEMRLWNPPGNEVPPAMRNGRPQSRPRWLTERQRLGLAAALAVLLIGAGVLYWHATSGVVKANNVQTNGDLAPISPPVGGTVFKVLVDARLGTVVIELTTVSPQTSRTSVLACSPTECR